MFFLHWTCSTNHFRPNILSMMSRVFIIIQLILTFMPNFDAKEHGKAVKTDHSRHKMACFNIPSYRYFQCELWCKFSRHRWFSKSPFNVTRQSLKINLETCKKKSFIILNNTTLSYSKVLSLWTHSTNAIMIIEFPFCTIREWAFKFSEVHFKNRKNRWRWRNDTILGDD